MFSLLHTTGAISGNEVDTKIEAQRNVEAEKIRAEIGDDAFKGLSALITCNHEDALGDAAQSKQSGNPNFAVSGYWLEVLVYADQANNVKTHDLIPGVVEKDWDTNSETEARTSLLQLEEQLMSIREEYKLAVTCK